jgi:RNA-directed DNA polymerase
LKAGFVENRTLFPTEAGTPQGGIISPVLANLTLDGLEHLLKENFRVKTLKGQRHSPKVNLIRYADDFIITGGTKELLENEVKPLVEQFLRDRGLQLSPEKTCVTHIEKGFDFLGMNVRKYGGKLLIKPSKKNTHAFLEKVREMIRRNKSAEQKHLIKLLNAVIRGWTNYHRHITATQAFRRAEMVIWQRLWHWAKRRHQDRSVDWIARRYWHRLRRKRRTFAADSGERTPDGNPKLFRLVDPTETRIRRYVKVKSAANPFDPDWRDYFEERAFFKMFGIHRYEAGVKPS